MRSLTSAPLPAKAPPSSCARADLLEGALRSATTPIRMGLALVYFHFGVLKLFPDLSGAEMIATQTIIAMRLGLGAADALFWLALFEIGIALLLALRVPMWITFPVFLAHMAGTFAPIFVLPAFGFKIAPFAPTLEGQYILKNVVFIAAGWTLFLAETSLRRANALRSKPTAEV